MRYTTRGIVLNYMKYGETSIIVRIFTELFGKQAYLVQGVRVPKAKHSMALFQPLMPLDMVVYHKKHTTLQRIIEAKCHIPIGNILSDLKKATIATFLTELLHKVLYEEEHNEALFQFLLQSILKLDELVDGHELFYLDFMLQLCRHLGLGCNAAAEMNEQLVRSGFSGKLDKSELALLDALLTKDMEDIKRPSRQSVRNLLAGIVRYFQLHIDTLDTLKSLPILQEISG
ncbi:MAG: DNA repair protein RecO [Candidatus Amoebophilus sp. 36-38]|nr:MAG: DNA repair protein RecO [Candidatus Amoebophilus sp. 36-38]